MSLHANQYEIYWDCEYIQHKKDKNVVDAWQILQLNSELFSFCMQTYIYAWISCHFGREFIPRRNLSNLNIKYKKSQISITFVNLWIKLYKVRFNKIWIILNGEVFPPSHYWRVGRFQLVRHGRWFVLWWWHWIKYIYRWICRRYNELGWYDLCETKGYVHVISKDIRKELFCCKYNAQFICATSKLFSRKCQLCNSFRGSKQEIEIIAVYNLKNKERVLTSVFLWK